MYDYDVVITRACLPPHVIRFFKLDQVTDDEPCLPYKELTIEAEPFWASVYKKFFTHQNDNVHFYIFSNFDKDRQ